MFLWILQIYLASGNYISTAGHLRQAEDFFNFEPCYCDNHNWTHYEV